MCTVLPPLVRGSFCHQTSYNGLLSPKTMIRISPISLEVLLSNVLSQEWEAYFMMFSSMFMWFNVILYFVWSVINCYKNVLNSVKHNIQGHIGLNENGLSEAHTFACLVSSAWVVRKNRPVRYCWLGVALWKETCHMKWAVKFHKPMPGSLWLRMYLSAISSVASFLHGTLLPPMLLMDGELTWNYKQNPN